MRSRRIDIRIVPAIAVLALAAWAGSAWAGKIRVLGTDTLNVSTSARPHPGHVRVDITTDGSDTNAIEIHPGRIHAHGNGNDLVRMGEDITIEENQVVSGDVVSIGGNVTVRGKVRGDAVSIGGNVKLEGTGSIEGDAVSIGGSVQRGPEAHLGGQNVGMRFVPMGLLGLARPHRRFGFLSVTLHLVWMLFLLLAAWIVVGLAERRVRVTAAYVETHLWWSLGTGLAVLILYPVAFLLLCVTIVGIPLALISPVALLLALIVGGLIVASLVGLRLIGGNATDRAGLIRAVLLGVVLFEGVPLIASLLRLASGPLHFLGIAVAVFGEAVIFVSASIGLGAIILSRFGRVQPAPAAPVAPAVPAGPGSQPTPA